MRAKFNRTLIFLLYGVIIISSCSSSVEITHFRIEYLQGTAARISPKINANVAIENFKSPAPLRRQEIIFRKEGEHKIFIDPYSLWWSLPEEMITEALINYLTESQLFQHVFSYPAPQQVPYILEGNLKQFEIQECEDEEHWNVKVGLQIYCRDSEKNTILWDSGIIKVSKPCKAQMEQAAKAMEKALREIFDQFTAQLKNSIRSDQQSKDLG